MTIDTTAVLSVPAGCLDSSRRRGARGGGRPEVLNVRAAALRHTVWTTVLGAMLLMPILLSIVPALPMPALPRRAHCRGSDHGPFDGVASASMPTQTATAGPTTIGVSARSHGGDKR